MTQSIKQFLLFNLLYSLVLVTLLTLLGTGFLEHKDLQRHTDKQLVAASLLFQSIFEKLDTQDIKNMQPTVNRLPDKVDKNVPFDWLSATTIPPQFSMFQFQICERDKVLLRSKYAPTTPFTLTSSGFSSVTVNNKRWRIFSETNENTGIVIHVALSQDLAAQLEARMTEDYLFVALLTSPILALLIWIIVGKGLEPLRRVADEVRNRAATYLEPVDTEHVSSEIKPLIEELNSLFNRVKGTLEREKRFASDAAHELRTPLAALKTQVQLALLSTSEVHRVEALNNVLRGVDRATHVVQQLLTLSRMSPEASTLEETKIFNLVTVAQEIIAMLFPAALKKQIEIELISNKTDVYLSGNSTAIGILLSNLIDNAIRYIPEGSHIQIEISEHADAILLKVIDDGPGILPELRDRVFERFFRILGTKTPGSGLGLAIVQQIAGLHNATVTLKEPPSGHGLEVLVRFSKIRVTG